MNGKNENFNLKVENKGTTLIALRFTVNLPKKGMVKLWKLRFGRKRKKKESCVVGSFAAFRKERLQN